MIFHIYVLYKKAQNFHYLVNNNKLVNSRLASGDERDSTSHGASAAHCHAGGVRHHHIRGHRPRTVHGQARPDLHCQRVCRQQLLKLR